MAGESSGSPASTPKRYALSSSVASTLRGDEKDAHKLFCRRCLTNLQIQSTLLSQHDPTTEGQAGAEEQLRASLDARYPILCAECRPAVEARLKAKNEDARREIWRDIMDEAKGRRSRPAMSAAMGRGRSRRHRQGYDATAAFVSRWLVAAAWLHVLAAGLVAGFVLAITTSRRLPLPPPLHLLTASIASHLAFTHIVLQPRIDFARQQAEERDPILDAGVGSEEEEMIKSSIATARALRCLVALSWVHLIAAALAQDGLPYVVKEASNAHLRRSGRAIYAVMASAQIAILARHLTKQHQSASTARNVKQLDHRALATYSLSADAGADPSSSATYDSFLSSISKETDSLLAPQHDAAAPSPHFGSATSTRPQRAPLSSAGVVGEEEEEEEEAMDWQPSPDRDDSDERAGVAARNRVAPSLGPQRFYAPEQLTGLEGLLQGGLSLDSDGIGTGRRGSSTSLIGQGDGARTVKLATLLHIAVGAAAALLVVAVGRWITALHWRFDWRGVYEAWIPVRQ
ncbi:hypothetical protein BDZ90DRAFT_260658 [Jaminaea rosea]|uniref:Ima1 N-terminal domain-containing protein n=1 Tax=Jaminaea rosea TaxID=1569628 RepID=A0A316UQA8_9BASI|nr:hypothetical protein BDZ90DRAFT_260658 [Jaminaea rosea]PWN26978.1 hypothetical protein BDZ90DRAFT_260658 [Jaminaea rosea]